MEKTHSKPSAARYGRGTAWARHAMCESVFTVQQQQQQQCLNNTVLTLNKLRDSVLSFKSDYDRVFRILSLQYS